MLIDDGKRILRLFGQVDRFHIVDILFHVRCHILCFEFLSRQHGIFLRIEKTVGTVVIGDVRILLVEQGQIVHQFIVGIFLEVAFIGIDFVDGRLHIRLLGDIDLQTAVI